MSYKFGAMSPSDPAKNSALGFYTREQAQQHADNMNEYLKRWDDPRGSMWNKTYWNNTKPEPWIVLEYKETT